MVAYPQIALVQKWLHQQGQYQGGDDNHRRPAQNLRVDEKDAKQGKTQVTHHLHEMQANARYHARHLDAVAAVGHVGHRAALKVTFAQVRQFFQQGHAQADFQVAAQTHGFRCNGHLDQHNHGHQGEQAHHRPKPLARQSQHGGDVKKTPEQQQLNGHNGSSDNHRCTQGRRAQQAILFEKGPQGNKRTGLLLDQRSGQFWGALGNFFCPEIRALRAFVTDFCLFALDAQQYSTLQLE